MVYKFTLDFKSMWALYNYSKLPTRPKYWEYKGDYNVIFCPWEFFCQKLNPLIFKYFYGSFFLPLFPPSFTSYLPPTLVLNHIVNTIV